MVLMPYSQSVCLSCGGARAQRWRTFSRMHFTLTLGLGGTLQSCSWAAWAPATRSADRSIASCSLDLCPRFNGTRAHRLSSVRSSFRRDSGTRTRRPTRRSRLPGTIPRDRAVRLQKTMPTSARVTRQTTSRRWSSRVVRLGRTPWSTWHVAAVWCCSLTARVARLRRISRWILAYGRPSWVLAFCLRCPRSSSRLSWQHARFRLRYLFLARIRISAAGLRSTRRSARCVRSRSSSPEATRTRIRQPLWT